MKLTITLTPFRQASYTATVGDWRRLISEIEKSHRNDMDIFLIEKSIENIDLSVNDEVTIESQSGILDRYFMLDLFESIEDFEMNRFHL